MPEGLVIEAKVVESGAGAIPNNLVPRGRGKRSVVRARWGDEQGVIITGVLASIKPETANVGSTECVRASVDHTIQTRRAHAGERTVVRRRAKELVGPVHAAVRLRGMLVRRICEAAVGRRDGCTDVVKSAGLCKRYIPERAATLAAPARRR